ncbi:MAG: hypothetical protein A2046_07080 [Bacteroidetes bacterium GWA2_30_7]|nr:MAG: hypothetical protein A2046_07080 [Bacteroidetes bacterium GWA2_30_7]
MKKFCNNFLIALKDISFKDKIQIFVSLLAISIAIYANTMSSIRDSASSLRNSESVKREKQQHNEIIKIYKEQKELLEKYNQNADSMLEILKLQANIADLQFENQNIITQPGVNVTTLIQDTLNTFLNFEDEQCIMPECILKLHNYGSRIAKNVRVDVKFISPNSKIIHSLENRTIISILPKATCEKIYYPIISLKDKKFFLIVIDIVWMDEFNKNKKTIQHLLYKCIRENNDFYSDGIAERVYLNLAKKIIDNPSKIVIESKNIRKYMYDTYNK